MSHASGHHFHQVQETGHADVDVLRHRIYRGCYLHQSWKRAFCQNRSCQRRSVDHHSGKRIWNADGIGYMTNNWQQVLSWCYCMDLSSMENVFLQFCLRQILLTFNVLTFSIVDCSPLCPRQFLTCILCVYLCAMYAKHFPDHEPIDATPIGSPEKKKPFIGKLSTFILYPVLSLANCKQRTDRNS